MTAHPGDAPATIMILRHGEKPEPGTSHGVTVVGHHDGRSLSVAGWVRAGALITLFACDGQASPRGLRRPDRVYGAAFRHGHSRREIQTVGPLAARLGVEVDTRYRAGDEVSLAEEIRDLPGVTLVCWHHKSMERIVENLGAVTPEPPRRWPDDRFDVVWIFTQVRGQLGVHPGAATATARRSHRADRRVTSRGRPRSLPCTALTTW